MTRRNRLQLDITNADSGDIVEFTCGDSVGFRGIVERRKDANILYVLINEDCVEVPSENLRLVSKS